MRAAQSGGGNVDVAVVDFNGCAHRCQAFDVLVDGTRANGAAAGQGDARLTAAGGERAEHEDGRAHGFHHLIRGDRVGDGVGTEGEAVAVAFDKTHAHLGEQRQQGFDVLQAGDVVERDRLGGEQRGAENGQGGILGAGDGDFTLQALAAFDNQGVGHGVNIPQRSVRNLRTSAARHQACR